MNLEDGYKKGMFTYHDLKDVISSAGDEYGVYILEKYFDGALGSQREYK